jgi:hypothetical protein
MEAVAKGDMKTAQRMVDAAAKAAGYTVGPVYHGGKVFNRFDQTKMSATTGRMQNAFYFTSSEDNAGFYDDGEI